MPKILAPFAVVAIGIVGAMALVRSKAPVETSRPEAVRPLVQVVEVRIGEVPMTVSAQGTVLPRTEAALAAQVAAEVVEVSPSFEAGGFFERGEALVHLDRRDYELAVERAVARVAQTELALAKQQAEARVAAEEWGQLGDGEPDPLVLREPQLAEARAVVKAAEAELGMARLALERTRIRAPFDGRIRNKSADVGQYLTPGQEVATVHAIDFAEVRLPVPDRQLAFLDLPLRYHNGSAGGGPTATLSANFAGSRHRWPGRVVRAEGELDQRSRMLHLVVRVEDPYGRRQPGRPPLAVGLFVDAEIAGRTVVGTLLPRSALRGDDRVLVVDEEMRLRFRGVDVVRTLKESVIVGSGLSSGERVCISPLDVIVDGMAVRVAEVENLSIERAASEPPSPEREADVMAETAVDRAPAVVEDRTASIAGGGFPDAGTEPVASGRLLSVALVSEGPGGQAVAASIGGTFSYSTSRLSSPERFVVDLIGVVKASPRAQLVLAEGPVARVRIGQFQSEPEPITRIVFDLRPIAGGFSPAVERTEQGLSVSFGFSPSSEPPAGPVAQACGGAQDQSFTERREIRSLRPDSGPETAQIHTVC